MKRDLVQMNNTEKSQNSSAMQSTEKNGKLYCKHEGSCSLVLLVGLVYVD